MGAERAKFEKEMKEKDSAATQQRDAAEAERMKKVRSMKDAERRASQTDNNDQENWVSESYCLYSGTGISLIDITRLFIC